MTDQGPLIAIQRHTGPSRGGFTLIELLVTIAILAILAAILGGALSSSRRKAFQVQCLSNLRQLGMATMAYCRENNDAMPYAWDRNNPDASENNFFALLKPVIYSEAFDGYFDFESGIFACPTRLSEPLEGNNPFRVSYGMNASNTVHSSGARRLVWQVNSPSLTLLIADVSYRHNHVAINRDSPDQIGYKHNDQANILYFDGHVKARSLSDPTPLTIEF